MWSLSCSLCRILSLTIPYTRVVRTTTTLTRARYDNVRSPGGLRSIQTFVTATFTYIYTVLNAFIFIGTIIISNGIVTKSKLDRNKHNLSALVSVCS